MSSIAPAWSPNGTQIVFRQGGELWMMGADGNGAHSLGIEGWSPAWSPDGSTIAFLGCCESHRASDGAPLLEVRVLTLDSGTVKNLDSWVPTDLNGPSWSPEGTLLVLRYD